MNKMINLLIKKLKKYKNNRFVILTLILTFLLPLYYVLYKIYIPKVNAFGCFDDCFNYLGAYFMLKEKSLYSEIFFNHQIIMPYLSLIIQKFTRPINIYELILKHRQFLLLFSFAMNFLLIYRFRLSGLFFTITYELSKFYYFGDRFLAEGFIVYLLAYLIGLVYLKMLKKRIGLLDYLLAGFFSWFIIFSREPYSLTAVLFFLILLYGRPFYFEKRISVLVFLILTAVVLLSVNMPEYFFNVVTVNNVSVLKSAADETNILGSGIIKIIFYPIMLFFGGGWNLPRYLLAGLSLSFIITSVYFLIKREIKLLIVTIILLASANLRYVPPGSVYYGTFHLLPWYGMFVMIVFIFWRDFYNSQKKTALFLIVALIGIFGYTILSPQSFIHDKVDTHTEFITNYGYILQEGEVIKTLAKPGDTLFLDGFDDLIYWQANMISSYKYSWYTSVMGAFNKYTIARTEMFKNNPPDFYYGSCPNESNQNRMMPIWVKKDYIQLYSGGKQTCIYVYKNKLREISDIQWKKVNDWSFSVPKNNQQFNTIKY